MRKTTPKQYAIALYELTKDVTPSKIDTVVGTFLTALKTRRALTKIQYIMDAFEAHTKEQEGVLALGITSAHPLEKKMVQHIATSFSKQAETTTAVDPTLIGGVVVRSQDTIFDGSIRKQLQILQQHLS